MCFLSSYEVRRPFLSRAYILQHRAEDQLRMMGHRGQWEWRILGLALGSFPIADDEMKAPRCKLRRSARVQGMEDGETQGAWTIWLLWILAEAWLK